MVVQALDHLADERLYFSDGAGDGRRVTYSSRVTYSARLLRQRGGVDLEHGAGHGVVEQQLGDGWRQRAVGERAARLPHEAFEAGAAGILVADEGVRVEGELQGELGGGEGGEGGGAGQVGADEAAVAAGG